MLDLPPQPQNDPSNFPPLGEPEQEIVDYASLLRKQEQQKYFDKIDNALGGESV